MTTYPTFEEWITTGGRWDNETIDLIDAWNAGQNSRQPEIDTLATQVAELTAERDALRDEMEGVGPPPSATQLREAIYENRRLATQVKEYRAVVDAAKRLVKHWVDYERLVEIGDPQAVALDRALAALESRPDGETAPLT